MTRGVVMVRTPDGDRAFEHDVNGEPLARPLTQAHLIAQQAACLARLNGWRLSYYVKELP